MKRENRSERKMGKSGKKQQQQGKQRGRNQKGFYSSQAEEEERNDVILPTEEEEEEEQTEEEESDDEEEEEKEKSKDSPCKFTLYQESVQSPKGDISYLQKFFLMYVGGRLPIHLQEDFCGTALLSTEWLRSDSRRTAVGVDLDLEALDWSLENNVIKLGSDGYSRISLFHGDVLRPSEARLVKSNIQDLEKSMSSSHLEGSLGIVAPEPSDSVDDELMKNCQLPPIDIVCAFNYSCCCLHKRADLVLYFKHAHNTLSKKGGIFVMDVYGGTSSEQGIRLQRKFPNFTYTWEQAEFDTINRMTRISLHYNLRNQRKLRHAFSYSWRLWSLPEIRDCMQEAGFRSVHFWIRQMPDTREVRSSQGFGVGRDVKYEEVSTFKQQDAWNAYIVGVAN